MVKNKLINLRGLKKMNFLIKLETPNQVDIYFMENYTVTRFFQDITVSQLNPSVVLKDSQHIKEIIYKRGKLLKHYPIFEQLTELVLTVTCGTDDNVRYCLSYGNYQTTEYDSIKRACEEFERYNQFNITSHIRDIPWVNPDDVLGTLNENAPGRCDMLVWESGELPSNMCKTTAKFTFSNQKALIEKLPLYLRTRSNITKVELDFKYRGEVKCTIDCAITRNR